MSNQVKTVKLKIVKGAKNQVGKTIERPVDQAEALLAYEEKIGVKCHELVK